MSEHADEVPVEVTEPNPYADVPADHKQDDDTVAPDKDDD